MVMIFVWGVLSMLDGTLVLLGVFSPVQTQPNPNRIGVKLSMIVGVVAGGCGL
jgi:hypothetical protein